MLQNNYCESYWTNIGAMDEVGEYLKYNVLEIRDEVIAMVSGEEIDVTIKEVIELCNENGVALYFIINEKFRK